MLPIALACLSSAAQPVFDSIAAGRLSRVVSDRAPVHGRSGSERTYAWLGNAEAVYSVPYDPSLAHTHGGKTVLIVKYRTAGSTCDTDGDYAYTFEECANVISDEDLQAMVAAGNASLYANSYGKAWLSTVTVVPSVLDVGSNTWFYDVVDNVREAAYAASSAYLYTNFDFDLIFKRVGDGQSAGGSAVPGGRAQTFTYDGSLSGFADKIFPHEFLHNFGTGHAFLNGQTYGDPFDITGGGYGEVAHVSAAVKHRFGWIEPSQAIELNPTTLPRGTTQRLSLRAFDSIDSLSDASSSPDEYLTARLDTRFMNANCDRRYNWCPDWNGSPWIGSAARGSKYYLYISYRARYNETADGATLHVAKYADGDWVDATALMPIRPTQPELPVIRAGETYVFDGSSATAIVVSVVSASSSSGVLVVDVGYIDGAAAATSYEASHAEHLCAHTLACGAELTVTEGVSAASLHSSSAVLVKIGESHSLDAQLRVCADSALLPDAMVYAFDEFPLAQALYNAPVEVHAQASMVDLCGGGAPGGISLGGTGVWWLDGVQLTKSEQAHIVFDPCTLVSLLIAPRPSPATCRISLSMQP